MTIKKGDVVKFKPHWQDEGDADITFIAVEDEDGGRVTVEAQIGLRFNPQQTVRTDMIED